jgi:hypothetical protein
MCPLALTRLTLPCRKFHHFTSLSHMTPQSPTYSYTRQYNSTHYTSNTSTPLLPPQSGQMHAMQGDWSKTVSSYRRSLEGFEAVCGKKDKRITEVSRLLKVRRDIFLFFQHLLDVLVNLFALSCHSDQSSARRWVYLFFVDSCLHWTLLTFTYLTLPSRVYLSHSFPTNHLFHLSFRLSHSFLTNPSLMTYHSL